MKGSKQVRKWRGWFPVPNRHGRLDLVRWVLLEGNRLAVTVGILVSVFLTLFVMGWVWTFEMFRLLTETDTVETILDTFIAGIMLLVPLVVSINAIVISHDITSVETQEARVAGVMKFRQKIGRLTQVDRRPSDPASFLEGMALVITQRSSALLEHVDERNQEFSADVHEFVEQIHDDIAKFENVRDAREQGVVFGVLWMGLEFDYGTHYDYSLMLQDRYGDEMSDEFAEHLQHLDDGFELFAVGKEYFKSLYYSQEVSRLSRVLLIASLPTILVTATAILAINQGLLPEVWLFGLPPLLTFMATVVTISLIPYILLTSYMLRLATVAIRTSTGGPFWLEE